MNMNKHGEHPTMNGDTFVRGQVMETREAMDKASQASLKLRHPMEGLEGQAEPSNESQVVDFLRSIDNVIDELEVNVGKLISKTDPITREMRYDSTVPSLDTETKVGANLSKKLERLTGINELVCLLERAIDL